MNLKEIIKYESAIESGKIKCKCGHSVILPPQMQQVICHWCGKYVFRNKKSEFNFRLKEAQNKNK